MLQKLTKLGLRGFKLFVSYLTKDTVINSTQNADIYRYFQSK